MPSYTLSVEPIAHAKITGRLGTLTAIYRRHEYVIGLGFQHTTRDGLPISSGDLPETVYRQADNWARYLSDAVRQSTL